MIQKKGVSDETRSLIIQNKEIMLDAIGIMQHHDAITGTAKQAVADDYHRILKSAMHQNNILYAELIGEKAKKAGIDTDESTLHWKACEIISSEKPVDCSIDHKISMIALHNPATIE